MGIVSNFTALLNSNNSRWNAFTAIGQPVVISFSFMETLPSYSGDIGAMTGFTVISESYRTAIREVIQAFDSATGIDFVEVTDSDSAQIRFGSFNFSGTANSQYSGFGYYPQFSPSGVGGDIFFNTAMNSGSGSPSASQIQLAAHELGHALGLEHPFDGTNILVSLLDTTDHTVMSYTNGHSYKSGPQDLDTLALNYYYGTSAAHEAAVNAAYSTAADRITITLAHVSGSGQTVSGTHSSDLILGSTGNDVIAGMAGADIIIGGAGTDQAVYYGPASQFSITADNGLFTIAPTTTGWTADVDGRDFLIGVEQVEFLNYNSGSSDVFSLAAIAVDQSLTNVVYRLYNHNTNGHFFTASAAERNQIISELAHFTFEGTAFGASTAATAAAGELEVFRFLNTGNGSHFYTASQAERDLLINTAANYLYEGIAYYGFESGTANTQELYRFYNSETGIHFYTASATERDATISNLPQFQYEGLAYNVDFI